MSPLEHTLAQLLARLTLGPAPADSVTSKAFGAIGGVKAGQRLAPGTVSPIGEPGDADTRPTMTFISYLRPPAQPGKTESEAHPATLTAAEPARPESIGPRPSVPAAPPPTVDERDCTRWALRHARLVDRQGDVDVWLRDFRMMPSETGRLIETVRSHLLREGRTPARIIVNGRLAWVERPGTTIHRGGT